MNRKRINKSNAYIKKKKKRDDIEKINIHKQTDANFNQWNYHQDLKDEDRNPDHKEDFDSVLKGLIDMNPDDLDTLEPPEKD